MFCKSYLGPINSTACILIALWFCCDANLAAQVVCLSTSRPTGTECANQVDEIAWLNRPAVAETLKLSSPPKHDPLVADPALGGGVWVSGEAQIKINTEERQFVEVFVMADDGGRNGFILLENGTPVDTLFGDAFDRVRMRPKGIRSVALLAVVDGGSVLSVRTTAPRWVLSAVRMTPQKEFESKMVPAVLERTRKFSDPFFEGLRQHRQARMQELWFRLIHSRQPNVHREALLGAARSAYWYAVENREPVDVALTEKLLEALAREMPEDSLVRQMISESYGLWASDKIENGYNTTIRDVEHSAEPTTDTQPILAALYPDDSEVLNRLATTTECLHNWLVQQPDGRWRFSSAWFNCDEIDTGPARAVDVHYNVRAAGPALWYAFLSRDKKIIDILSRWGESWLEVMRKTDHGKPAGIFPSTVESHNGNYLVRSTSWDKPNAEWDYFQWSGNAQERLTGFFLGLYNLTGEHRWLEAVGESFEIMKECETQRRLCDAIRSEPEAFYQWRRLTGRTDYDAAFGVTPAKDRSEILAMMKNEALKMSKKAAVRS